jgi:apolipoprotein D and lipocalin family protein
MNQLNLFAHGSQPWVVIAKPAAWQAMAVVSLVVAFGCATTTGKRSGAAPPITVPRVDLNRYLGTWYEIAAFPQRFERGCTATTATYSRRADGRIDVVNSCRLGSPNGKLKTAKGLARVLDAATNAKLKVSFFRPFWGNYWIIDLGPNYEYAVVGDPSRDYLWILARRPTLDDAIYQEITKRLQAQGYETARLVKTVQVADPAKAAGEGNAAASAPGANTP